MPKVSIVIPTLNRARLLQYALKSAVNQDYKNLEIVICDDYSEDNTKEVVESFNNQNIIYIRTDKRLNMPDTFEFGLSKTKGEYVTFLTDSSYLLPDCISFAIKKLKKFNAKLAVWKNSVYFYPDWIELERKNILQIPRATYKSFLLNSKEGLQKWYSNIRGYADSMPRSINSLCHRSIIEKTLNIQSQFFLPPCPDYSSGMSMLINSSDYLLLDRPLFIGSTSLANTGASQSFNLGKSAQDFLKGFDQKLEDIAFLGIYTTPALIIKSLENVRKFYPNSCPELNIKNTLCEIADSLSKLEVYGKNVNDYWQILEKYATNQSKEIKLAIIKKKIQSKIKWSFVKTIRSSPYLFYLEFLRNMYILKGSKFGFNNIEEAAKIINRWNQTHGKVKL